MYDPGPDLHSINASGTFDAFDAHRQSPFHFTIGQRARPFISWGAPYQLPKIAIQAVAAAWQELSESQKAAWLELAHHFSIGRYHAFVKKNLPRQRAGLPLLQQP